MVVRGSAWRAAVCTSRRLTPAAVASTCSASGSCSPADISALQAGHQRAHVRCGLVSADSRFHCRTCGQWHDGPPLAFAWDAPAYWSQELVAEPLNVLEPEICIIKDQG